MKPNKIIKKLFKFEMITWFAWIHLTGSTLDMIMDKYPIMWARSSWFDFRDLCNAVNSKDFRNDLKEAMEEYVIRKNEVAEIEHEKHGDDEIDEKRKNLRKDKADLKAEKDEIENGDDLVEMCENKEREFEEFFGLKCDDLNMRNNWLVVGSIIASAVCLILLHKTAKPNYETLNGAKFICSLFGAIIFFAANAVQVIHVIIYWAEAKAEVRNGDLFEKNVYKNLKYGEQPDKYDIKLTCKYDYLRYNFIVHGIIMVSSFLMCVVLVFLNYQKARQYRKSLDLEKAPEQEHEKEIKKMKHKKELKKLDPPKAGEKVNEQKKDNW